MQAVLRVPDAVLGTNVCSLRVRSRAVLDGAASGTFVELLDAEHVSVRAVVTNEGDGAARDVRVVVAAPRGCVRADDDEPAVAEFERLEAGASVTVGFEARIVAPVAVVAADDAEARHGGMRRCMLPVREVVVLEPVIAAPCVQVRPGRRSVDVGVDVRNDGWVDARDVRVRIALPPPLRAIDGSVAVDGVPVAARVRRGAGGGDAPFARVERAAGAHVVVAQVTRAQHGARRAVCGVSRRLRGWNDRRRRRVTRGHGAVRAGTRARHSHAADRNTALRRAGRRHRDRCGARERRRRRVRSSSSASPGRGSSSRPEAVARTIAPGSVAVVELAARAQPAAALDAPLPLSVVACDAERERARVDFAVARARSAYSVLRRCRGCRRRNDCPPSCTPRLHGPDEISAGAAFTLRLDIDVEDRRRRARRSRSRGPGRAVRVRLDFARRAFAARSRGVVAARRRRASAAEHPAGYARDRGMDAAGRSVGV